MKRPEYVGVVTRAYREALDAAQARVPYHPSADTLAQLRQIFNRGGFTEGYAMGRSNAALMSWERPNHWGIPVGRITALRGPLARARLSEDLHDGDGLQVRGKNECDLTYSGSDTARGGEATVRVAAGGASVGDAVYRLTDAVQMKDIREAMSREGVRIPLTAELRAVPGELPVLRLSDSDGHSVQATGDTPVMRAQQRAMTVESAMKQIGKTGGTPYEIETLSLVGEQAFMMAGMLNALRRDALEAMRKCRIAPRREAREPVHVPVRLPDMRPMLIAQGENLADMQTLIESGADAFVWQPQSYRIDALEQALAACPQARPAFFLPTMTQTAELEDIHAFVLRHAGRFCAVVVSNPGQLALDWPSPIWGGQGLNVMNEEAAAFFFAAGAQRLTASCELSAGELRELFDRGGNYEIEAYGRTQLMLLSHCPHRTQVGDERQDAACNACASRGGVPDIYTDRKGYRFSARRLRMEHGCVVRLYNSVPTDMARYARQLHALGCSLRVSFTDEPIDRQMEIVSSYRSILDRGVALHQMEENVTAGHLKRGVE